MANNAGGALCKRGSSYTEYALYARVNEQGTLELIDHLGIRNLGETPEEILTRLEAGEFTDADLIDDGRVASDNDYVNRIRTLDADVPNRYNADPKRLYEASGSAGKVACFAVRVDTFQAPKKRSRCSFLAPTIRSLRHDASRHSRHLRASPGDGRVYESGNIHCSREVRKGRGACD